MDTRFGVGARAPEGGTSLGLVAGRYRIEREVARGGMGAVLIALDEVSGRRVALKRLLDPQRKPAVVLSFEREFETLSRLAHPAVIEVFDYGVDAAGPYYTMELLGGADLHALAPVPMAKACEHLRDVASSLALLHARRTVHRDVSPRNIRLTADGRAKLIDFGALASFGQAPDVIGTPPCMPPEVLRRGQLDQRADIYALGAVAYFLLTGGHAYRAAGLTQLARAYRREPPPPSSVVKGVPPALDELVMSMLNLDPRARPQSAGEVIVRLNEIASLPAQTATEREASYFLNPTFVGRDKELSSLTGYAKDAAEGRGRAVMIEGAEGTGKTRLLSELGLRAQLLGLSVVVADASVDQSPFGLLTAMGRTLLDTLPDAATTCFAPHAGALSHLIPALQSAAGGASTLPEDPAERRARVQSAFVEALLALSVDHPLAIAIDGYADADAGSRAVLDALSRKLSGHKLLLAVSVSGRREAGGSKDGRREAGGSKDGRREAGGSSGHLRGFSTGAVRVALRELRADDTHSLVRSLFGDVPDVGRLASRLHALSAGNPMLCMELARHLVECGVVTYLEGTWVVGRDPSAEDLPATLGAAWISRLDKLSGVARKLAEILAVFRDTASMERVLLLARDWEHASVLDALDELVRAQFLSLSSEGYRFSHESLRKRVLETMNEQSRRELERRCAAALAELGEDDVMAVLQRARHLLAAGEDLAGADLLCDHAYRIAFGSDALPTAVDELERALAICLERGVSPYRYLWLLVGLCQAGWLVHPRYRLRHAGRTLELLGQVTGLALAHRLPRPLGRRMSVIFAIGWTSLRTSGARKGTPFAAFKQIFVALSRGMSGIMAGAAVSMDVEEVERVLHLLEPMRALGNKHVGAFVYEYCQKIGLLIRGCEPESLALCKTNLATLEDPECVKELPPVVRAIQRAGCYHTLGLARALACMPTALDAASELRRCDFAFYRGQAGQVSGTYHAALGDYAGVRAELERVELESIQGGSSWSNEVLLPILMMTSYDLADDVIGLQRAAEVLRRWAQEVPSLETYHQAATMMYASARGRSPNEVLLRVEDWVAKAVPKRAVGWAHGRALQARLLNRLGRYAEAKRVAEETVALMTSGERAFPTLYLEVERQLAFADAHLGDHSAAVTRLTSLLELHGPNKSPLHLGILCEARALIAQQSGEQEVFLEYLKRARDLFATTGNPRLIARIEQLSVGRNASAATNAESESPELGTVMELGFDAELDRAIGEVNTLRGRASAALDVVLRHLGAGSGYIYLGDGDVLELVASHGERASEELVAGTRQTLGDLRAAMLETSAERTVSLAPEAPSFQSSVRSNHQVIPLHKIDHEAITIVGALILPGDAPLPSAQTLMMLARRLAS